MMKSLPRRDWYELINVFLVQIIVSPSLNMVSHELDPLKPRFEAP